jgi:hypothetical protein
MMTEKRRGMATRAKANGSLVRSFRSTIYIIRPFNIESPASPSSIVPIPSILGAIGFVQSYLLSYNIGRHK